MQHRCGDHHAAFVKSPPGFFADFAEGRDGVEQHERRFAGNHSEIQRCADSVEVERGRTAGDQDEVGGTGRRQRSRIGVRGTVDDPRSADWDAACSSRLGNRAA
jgi:hypothetical protein